MGRDEADTPPGEARRALTTPSHSGSSCHCLLEDASSATLLGSRGRRAFAGRGSSCVPVLGAVFNHPWATTSALSGLQGPRSFTLGTRPYSVPMYNSELFETLLIRSLLEVTKSE